MGRPRKPTKLLELNGAFKKNPARALERENEPLGHKEIGDPPADFLKPESPTAVRRLEIWHRFIAEAPRGCITGSDRTRLANACRLQEQIDRIGDRATPSMHAMMDRYLAGFGMTAIGRAQKGVQGRKAPGTEAETSASGWAAFAGEQKAARFS